MCTITKGDLPIKIWWRFHDGNEEMSYNLTTNDGIVVTRNSPKVSILTIDAVKARHRGNYTCFAQNKGGFVQQSAYLAINGDISERYSNYFNSQNQNFAICFTISKYSYLPKTFFYTHPSSAICNAIQFWGGTNEP